MKRLAIILFFAPLFAIAQKRTHTVAPKESFTSIGRLYNVNGRLLANYNDLDYDRGLTIGQVLKIPATETMPATVKAETPRANPTVVSKATGTPVYHTVTSKETLYQISNRYGKVPIADIKKWNNLTGDDINEGATLIVGYKEGAGSGSMTKKEDAMPPLVKEKVEADIQAVDEPVVPVKEKPSPVKVENLPVKQPPTVRSDVNFKGGTFKNEFNKNDNETENGMAVVFKSNSGWEDGKYYCLHNTAPENSIVKITNAAGRSVYAKVLDLIPGIKQNEGATILISNAAAAELGMSDNKFDCTVTYSK